MSDGADTRLMGLDGVKGSPPQGGTDYKGGLTSTN